MPTKKKSTTQKSTKKVSKKTAKKAVTIKKTTSAKKTGGTKKSVIIKKSTVKSSGSKKGGKVTSRKKVYKETREYGGGPHAAGHFPGDFSWEKVEHSSYEETTSYERGGAEGGAKDSGGTIYTGPKIIGEGGSAGGGRDD